MKKITELRGPGEYSASDNLVLPQFAIADLVTDGNVLEVAREEAAALWQIKNWQMLPEYQPLAQSLR